MKITKKSCGIYAYINSNYNLSNKLAFDVGAAKGDVSKKLVKFGALVIAIEPQKRRTNHKNFIGVKKIINNCVSDKNGEIEFFRCKSQPNISTCSKDWKRLDRKINLEWAKPIILKTITLDQIIKEYGIPYYIKIDVENHELNVLKGLSFKPRVISFEYTANFKNNFEKCLKELKRIGDYDIKAFEFGKKRKNITLYEFSNEQECLDYYNSLNGLKQGDLLITY